MDTNVTPAPRRSPWHAPLFLVGAGCLVAVWFGRPLFPETPARRVERDLAGARQQLSRTDGDPELAVKLAARALEVVEPLSPEAGEATFLLGSAHAKVAEKAGVPDKTAHWTKARQYLEQASAEPLSALDSLRLKYRLAKALLALDAEADKAIAYLEETTAETDTRVEGYSLLTRAYLAKTPPDLEKALDANRRLRDVAEISEEDLLVAKVQGGELLLKLGKPDEARKSLDNMPETAPPALLFRSRVLQAKASQALSRWADAATLYQKALADNRFTPESPGAIYHDMGRCYFKMGSREEAKKAWHDCLRVAKDTERPAAALVLAKVHLLEGAKLDEASAQMASAVTGISSAAGWNSPLMDLESARKVFDDAGVKFRKSGRHDLALKLLDAYERLRDPSELLALRGEIGAEAAKLKTDSGKVLTPAEEANLRELHKKAGEAFAKAAALPGADAKAKAERLWDSARSFEAAGDEAAAVRRLEELTRLDAAPDVRSEALYRLAELYRKAKEPQKAEAAYRECASGVSPKFAARARYQLALRMIDDGQFDAANSTLTGLIKQLKWEQDDETLSKALFTLGNMLYAKGKYYAVYQHLEAGLMKVKAGPEATKARYQLADSYRRLATEQKKRFIMRTESPESNAHSEREFKSWMRKAADEFAALCVVAESPEGKDHLPPELRRQLPLLAGKCWFHIDEHEKALAVYDKVIARHGESVDSLEALGQTVTCYAAMGRIPEVKQRLLMVRGILDKATTPEDVKAIWGGWLGEAMDNLQKVEAQMRGQPQATPVSGGKR